MCHGEISCLEGVPTQTVLVAVLQVWTACVCGGNSPGDHICPAIWRGRAIKEITVYLTLLASLDSQVFLEWSKERYTVQFSIYADNVAGKSYEDK